MPYISKDLRPALDKDYMVAKQPGDLAYVFAKFFYRVWLSKPSWTTYHNLEVMIRKPELNEDYNRMTSKLSMSTYFTSIDIQVAARAALNELFWRCVRKYEDGKKISNGDCFKEI